MDNSAIGQDLLPSPLKISDLGPGTPHVDAKMLFEKLNLILVAAHNDRRQNAFQQVVWASAKNHFVTQFL
jgi:hypothetical protein